MLDHIVDVLIALPPYRSFSNEQGGRRLSDELPDGFKIMKIFVINQLLVDTFELLLFIRGFCVSADGKERNKEEQGCCVACDFG